MTDQLHPKLGQLNRLFKEIQQYKADHPSEKLGYYTNNIGSILNAYREGDLNFEEAIAAIKSAAQPEQPAPAPGESLRDRIRKAIDEYPRSFGGAIYESDVERFTDALLEAVQSHIAASVIAQGAAQVGVDREKLIERLTMYVESARMVTVEPGVNDVTYMESMGALKALQELFDDIKRGDFDCAIPPSGDAVAAVKAGYVKVENCLIELEHIGGVTLPVKLTHALLQLQLSIDAIASLSAPGRTDSPLDDGTLFEWLDRYCLGLYHSPRRGWWVKTKEWTQEGFWPTAQEAIRDAINTMAESGDQL